MANRPWHLNLDEEYKPSISILVPTYNEESLISYKLDNLYKLKYSKDLIQIIIVDSASTDNTINKVHEFIENNSTMNIKVLEEKSRKGKSKALNFALKYATGDVIIVSDADSFLPSNILLKSLPILNNKSIGAYGGREVFLNTNKSWVALSEESYLSFMDTIKLGESKIHSTIFMEGGFSVYKKEYLSEFDTKTGSDDCGTALSVIQKGFRTLFIPEARFYTIFPDTFSGKFSIKIRRANQLLQIWIECLTLLLQSKLKLSKKIVLFETFLYLINPLIFLMLVINTIILTLQYMPNSLIFILFFTLTLVILRIPYLFLNFVQSNFILLYALLGLIFGKEFTVWTIPKERQMHINKEILNEKGLI